MDNNEDCPKDVPFDHHDLVEARHRFSELAFRGERWDLSHLDAFALRLDPGLGFEIDVVILFSCHCFTHSLKRDPRRMTEIPQDELFVTDQETRVLSDERYKLSRQYLHDMMTSLPKRDIRIAGTEKQNFMTFTALAPGKAGTTYTVFFEVLRDRKRAKRIVVRVQSAYAVPLLTRRQQKAQKVRGLTLLRAAYEGRGIRS